MLAHIEIFSQSMHIMFQILISFLRIVLTNLHPPPKQFHLRQSRVCRTVDTHRYISYYTSTLLLYLYVFLLIPKMEIDVLAQCTFIYRDTEFI